MGTIKETIANLIPGVTSATIGHLFGRLVNVILPFIILSLYGISLPTDTFFFILAVALFFNGTLATAITDSTVPIIVKGVFQIDSHGRILTGLISGLIAVFITAIWLFIEHQVNLFTLFGIFLIASSGVISAYSAGVLHAHGRFSYTGSLWLIRVVPVAVYWWISPGEKYLAMLVFGLGIADCVRAYILTYLANFYSKKTGASSQYFSSIRNSFLSYSPLVVALIIMGINPLIDRVIANTGITGSISLLEGGERVYSAIAMLCTIGIMPVLLTSFSKDHAQGKLNDNWPRILLIVISWTLLWLVFGIVVGLFVIQNILEYLTLLTPQNITIIIDIYWYYLLGLPAFTIGLAYGKKLQACQIYWLFTPITVLAVIVNGILSYLLMQYVGLIGIAIATTVIYSMNCILLIFAANRFTQNT